MYAPPQEVVAVKKLAERRSERTGKDTPKFVLRFVVRRRFETEAAKATCVITPDCMGGRSFCYKEASYMENFCFVYARKVCCRMEGDRKSGEGEPSPETVC